MEDDENYVEYVPVAIRRENEAQIILQRCKEKELESSKEKELESNPIVMGDLPVSQEKAINEEEKTLVSKRDIEPIYTGWRPPLHIRSRPENDSDLIRKRLNILVDGDDIPPPLESFKDMRFLGPILMILKEKKIKKPTPFQIQALPVVLSGRDLIGISLPGSGKKLVFVLPLILMAMQEELNMPLISGEGPLGLIVCPSQELARQTYQFIEEFVVPFKESGYPQYRTLLCIGGVSISSQMDLLKKGVHIVVATPGRLLDMLRNKRMNLGICRHLILDEAETLLGLGFEDGLREVFDNFKGKRQTLLFSSIKLTKVEKIVRDLVNPVTVHVKQEANLDVIQEFEYVKQDAKFTTLLNCIQKTNPPVLIICDRKGDVDSILQYLLHKEVNVVGIHGEKYSKDRQQAVTLFKTGKKQVLVATDRVLQGLSLPGVRHVINYDLPEEVDRYMCRVAKASLSGFTGISTSFVNPKQSKKTLLDLKRLLEKGKQKVPNFLAELSEGKLKN